MLIFLRVTISFKSPLNKQYLSRLPDPAAKPAVASGLNTALAFEEDLPFSLFQSSFDFYPY